MSKNCWMSVGYCLLRPVCLNTYGKYSIIVQSRTGQAVLGLMYTFLDIEGKASDQAVHVQTVKVLISLAHPHFLIMVSVVSI